MSEALTNVFRVAARPVGRALGALGVSPNAVTLATGAVAVGAGVAIGVGAVSGMSAAAGVLIVGALDVVDGAVARTMGQATPFGAVLDSIVDRVADGAILAGVLFAAQRAGDTNGVLAAACAATAFPLVSYVRAKAEALQIPCKDGIANRTVRVLVLAAGFALDAPNVAVALLALASLWTAARRTWIVYRALTPPEPALNPR